MSYEIFKRQLPAVNSYYPDLKIIVENEKHFLRGDYDIYDAAGVLQETYTIELRYKEGFPKMFPELFEIGGKIPKSVDWHIHGDGSCCIDVPPGETLACYNLITVLRFLENQVRAYLAKQTYRRKEGYYPGEEYAHDFPTAVLQFYAKELRIEEGEKDKILKILMFIISKRKVQSGILCPCESGKVVKKCHLSRFIRLLKLSKERLLFDYKVIRSIER